MHTKTYLLVGAVVVVILGYILFMRFQTSVSAPTDISGGAEPAALGDVPIIRQEKAFGISGLVTEIGNDFFVMESSMLPGVGDPQSSWRWTVRYLPTTVVLQGDTKKL